jgi:thiol:disulfide interchange protein DsbD
MYGAAGWLVWVLSQQAGGTGLARILALLLLLAFAAWLFGLTQRGGRGRLLILGLAAVLGLAAFVGAVIPAYPAPPAAGEAARTDIPSEPFSPERLAAARAEGRPVFVNFTAAWCVTCQVNERAALSSPAVAQAFRDHRVVYLVGDWTNRDAVIAHALAEHGRDGVPLYLMYPASGPEPRVLPQLLTEGLVIEAVTRASQRNGA